MYRTAPNPAILHRVVSLASTKAEEVSLAFQITSELLASEVNLPLDQLEVNFEIP